MISLSLGRARGYALRSLKSRQGFGHAVSVYFATQLVQRAFDLASFGLMVNSLGIADFGFLTSATLFAFVGYQALSAGMFHIGIPRFWIDKDTDLDAVRGMAVALFAGFLLVIVLPTFCAAAPLAAWMGGGRYAPTMRICLVTAAFRLFCTMGYETLRMERRPLEQGMTEMGASLVSLVGSAVVFIVARGNIVAMANAQMTGWIFMALVIFFRHFRLHRPDWSLAAPMLRFSVPVMTWRLMAEVNRSGSRLMVLMYFGLHAVGLWAFAVKLAEFYNFALQPVQKAWTPQVMALAQAGREDRAVRGACFYLLYSFAAFVGFVISTPLLIWLVDRKHLYGAAHPLIPLLYLGFFFQNFYTVFGMGFMVKKRTGPLLAISLASGVLNITVSYLIARFGALDLMPIASALSFLLIALASHTLSKPYFDYPSPVPERIAFTTGSIGTLLVLLLTWA